MSNGMSDFPTPAEVSAEASAFASSLDMNAEAASVSEAESMTVPSELDSDIEVESTWADSVTSPREEQQSLLDNPEVSTEDTPELSAQTITFKANGEDIELTLDEAQKRLSLAEGARQALQDRSKLRKEVTNLKKQAEELAQYKDTWDKLESVKHDRKQLLELITGESYDDLINSEAERREIYQNGSDEQRQLLDYAERVQRLEKERELENTQRDSSLKKAESAKFDAEKQRVQTSMEREYYKHKLPEDLDPSSQNKLKAMLWQQSAADLKQYYQKYGKITNKMVEKAFADNSQVLSNFHTEAVNKEVSKVRETKKQVAMEKAQIASTKDNGAEIDPKLTGLNANQLFDLFRKR